MINCLNKFCIYNKDDACICDYVSLDISGLCDDCILINLEDDILEERKQMLLNSYTQDY